MIHPEDRESFRALFPYGKIFRRVGTRGEMIVLAYGAAHFRVLPDIFWEVTFVPLSVGDRVRFQKGNATLEGTIRDIYWHFTREAPYFLLNHLGRRLSKRFSLADLTSAPLNEA